VLFYCQWTSVSLDFRKMPSCVCVCVCVCDVLNISANITSSEGRAIAEAVSRCFPPRRPGFDPASGQVGFVVDKVARGWGVGGGVKLGPLGTTASDWSSVACPG
jgi:hypothetical protein